MTSHTDSDTTVSTVRTTAELLAALEAPAARCLCIEGRLDDVPAIALRPGVALCGGGADAELRFRAGVDGIALSRDNRLEGLRIIVDDVCRAVFNTTDQASLGRLALKDLVVAGQVSLMVQGDLRGGHVDVEGLDIVSADCRHCEARPRGFGVEVVQGAFTLWNRSEDTAVVITADLTGLRVGRPGAPVLGSGIFVSGAGDAGAELRVARLVTGPVYSDARIPPGTADVISGGVFTVHGARVTQVHNLGPVVTYGPNDMVLDNWGVVDRWIADAPVTSFGPSGIGFVNFGTLVDLEVNAPIETFGQGSRGFNVYDGTFHRAVFDRIVTHADGAVGVQISKRIDSIVVRRGIETFGGTGQSLVKGVVMTLSAIPLSVKPGGVADVIDIRGGLVAHGDGVVPLEVDGTIGSLTVAGGVRTSDAGFARL